MQVIQCVLSEMTYMVQVINNIIILFLNRDIVLLKVAYDGAWVTFLVYIKHEIDLIQLISV